LIKYIKNIYPDINLIEVDKIDLEDIASGEIYGTIGGSYLLAHQIAKLYPHRLKIMTYVIKKPIEASFGITTREPLLLGIINKSIEQIPEKLRRQILHSYKNIKIQKHIDYKLVWQILVIFVFVLMIIVIAYVKQRRLHNEIKQLNSTLNIKIKQEVEKNREKDRQLMQQTKLAQMGEMIGAIAHQWRQPLNTISTGIQNLKYDYKEGKLEDEIYIKSFIDKNKKTVKFMSSTIDDFRNFFRVDKEKHTFDVRSVTKSVINMLSAQLQMYNIEINLQGETFESFGFESEYQQVILNIISNAKDALVANNIKNPTIDIKIDKNKISIEDNGGGIAKDIIDRIFEPYYTSKEQGKGTGMGLYLSKMIIVDSMGGELSVRNSDNGAVFEMSFKGE